MNYFGKPWNKLTLEGVNFPTPVGVICLYCEEAIEEGDDGTFINGMMPEHRECFLRQIAGSVGHQQKKCSCYGGTEEDPPGVTVREAAKLATQMFEQGMKNES